MNSKAENLHKKLLTLSRARAGGYIQSGAILRTMRDGQLYRELAPPFKSFEDYYRRTIGLSHSSVCNQMKAADVYGRHQFKPEVLPPVTKLVVIARVAKSRTDILRWFERAEKLTVDQLRAQVYGKTKAKKSAHLRPFSVFAKVTKDERTVVLGAAQDYMRNPTRPAKTIGEALAMMASDALAYRKAAAAPRRAMKKAA